MVCFKHCKPSYFRSHYKRVNLSIVQVTISPHITIFPQIPLCINHMLKVHNYIVSRIIFMWPADRLFYL